MKPCITHHHACDCREHKVAVLIKAALDAVTELDGLNGAIHRFGLNGVSIPASIEISEFEVVRSIVERVYDACEQLGAQVGAPEEKPPCDHVVIVADVCAKCGAEVVA
jgi:hypothetical protein